MKHNYLKHLFTALLLMCTTVATAHDFEVGGVYYNILSDTDKTVEVTYKGNSYSEYSNEYTGSVVIPQKVTYNGTVYNVICIGNYAFTYCTKLASVKIPNSVTGIGEYSFVNCSGLTSVEIPNSVISIGRSAFADCSRLASIKIPNSVTVIELFLFSGCSSLTSVMIPNSVTRIGNYAFQYCSGLTNIEIPNSVTSIGQGAFYYCYCLESITIPNSVTSIGEYAFSDCTALIRVNSLITEKNLFGISSNVFNGIDRYACTLYVPYGTASKYRVAGGWDIWLGKIEELPGGKCGEDVSWTYGNGMLVISGNGTMDSTPWDKYEENINSVVIENGVANIREYAFCHCENLSYITIPSSITSIETYAFYNCSGLTSIEIPNSVTSIGNRAFSYSGLIDVVIPNSVTRIESQVFSECHNLRSIVIPNSVTSIGGEAFCYCNSLTCVVIPNSVTSIGGGAFVGTAWYDNQPDGIVYAGKVLYKYKGTMPANTSIVVKEGTLGIAGSAFRSCSGLKSIVIPNSVTNIGNGTFEGCSGLTSVTSQIPAENLFTISSYVFDGIDKTACTLYVPYGAKETYASTAGWSEFTNIVEPAPEEITITINQYGSGTYCSEYALDFSNVEGLKAYAATGYNSKTGVITLTRLQTACEGTGLFLKGEPGEYTVPVLEATDDHSLNMLVGTLEKTAVNGISSDGVYANYKYTIQKGESTPMFYQFADGSSLSANKAYLQIPVAWTSKASKSISIRFDDGETTGIEEVEGENGYVKGVYYDLQGRVVENPTNGIYIVDGKKVFIK